MRSRLYPVLVCSVVDGTRKNVFTLQHKVTVSACPLAQSYLSIGIKRLHGNSEKKIISTHKSSVSSVAIDTIGPD